MIHVRLYRSMAGATVELSCRHGGESAAGTHLVYRAQVDLLDDSPTAVWSALADHVCTVAALIHEDRLEAYDDCGW